MPRKARNIALILVALSIAALLWYAIQHRETPEQSSINYQQAVEMYSGLQAGDILVMQHGKGEAFVVAVNNVEGVYQCKSLYYSSNMPAMWSYEDLHRLNSKVIKAPSPEWINFAKQALLFH